MKNFFIIIFLTTNISSEEFLYPVACDNEKNIYIIHQKSLFSLELILWNPIKKDYKKILSEKFSPGGLKLLPNNKGFSFIDQGRLRIKYTNQTEIKSIDFFEPIHEISAIEWIDEKNCYFSAKKNNHLAIFQFNTNTQKITCIQSNIILDCVYPQKINSDLFFITREVNENYRTVKNFYKIIKTGYNSTKQYEIIADTKSNPIAFLKMISDAQGFYIQHPNIIDRQDKFIIFSYIQLFKENDGWQNNELFSFTLPIKLLFGKNDQRLYESILPFLPKYDNEKIFFCDCRNDENYSIDIYCYDIKTKETTIRTKSIDNQIFFAPLIMNNQIFYGTNLKKELNFKNNLLNYLDV